MYKNLGFCSAVGTSELSYIGISNTGIAIRIRGKSIVENPTIDYYVQQHFKQPVITECPMCGRRTEMDFCSEACGLAYQLGAPMLDDESTDPCTDPCTGCERDKGACDECGLIIP